MDRPADSERPIGFWLKAADDALTRAVDAAQQEHGVTRLEWQVLHAIEVAGRMDLPHLLQVLRPLGPMDQLVEALDRFVEEGWLDEGVDGPHQIKFYQLTGQGHERHALILARQMEVRGAAMAGIAADDYTTAVRVLERLVSNLSPTPGDPPPA